MAAVQPVILDPGAGRALFGGRFVFKVDEAETGGAFSVHEATVPPQSRGARPHTHDTADEAMYVLEGVLVVELGDEAVECPAGSFILLPRGARHTYHNPDETPARFLGILSPAAVTAARARRRSAA